MDLLRGKRKTADKLDLWMVLVDLRMDLWMVLLDWGNAKDLLMDLRMVLVSWGEAKVEQ